MRRVRGNQAHRRVQAQIRSVAAAIYRLLEKSACAARHERSAVLESSAQLRAELLHAGGAGQFAAELWFDSVEEMEAAFSGRQTVEILMPDLANFIELQSAVFLVSEENVIYSGAVAESHCVCLHRSGE
jgi:methylaspartate ammonia-lyase